MTGVSPFAPARFPDLGPVAGVRFAGAATGLKKAKGVHDLMLAEFAPGTTAAGVYTRSLCPSAPVEWCRKILPKGKARGLVVNSGNANAFTGTKGDRTVEATAKAAAEILGAKPREIFVASTGVIGNILPDDAIPQTLAGPGEVARRRRLARRRAGDHDHRYLPQGRIAHRADRRSAGHHSGLRQGVRHDRTRHGDHAVLRLHRCEDTGRRVAAVLKRGADRSFNAITVDSDTSTSDTLMLFATGQATHPG